MCRVIAIAEGIKLMSHDIEIWERVMEAQLSIGVTCSEQGVW